MNAVSKPLQSAAEPYSGVDNLRVMRVARNYNRHLVELICRHLGPEKLVCPILDAGAGLGVFARALRQRGFDVMALEPDEAMAHDLAKDGFTTFTSPQSMAGYNLGAMYSLNVLEHIEDDVAALKQWRAAMKPGAPLFIYVPAFQHLYSPMDRLVGHYRRYTRASLCKALEAAGFRVQASQYADSIGYAASWPLKFSDPHIREGSVGFYDRYLFPLSAALHPILGKVLGKNVWALAFNRGHAE